MCACMYLIATLKHLLDDVALRQKLSQVFFLLLAALSLIYVGPHCRTAEHSGPIQMNKRAEFFPHSAVVSLNTVRVY